MRNPINKNQHLKYWCFVYKVIFISELHYDEGAKKGYPGVDTVLSRKVVSVPEFVFFTSRSITLGAFHFFFWFFAVFIMVSFKIVNIEQINNKLYKNKNHQHFKYIGGLVIW
jgi:hypothetical protein